MITIKCAKCRNKLFKYHKVGKGKVIHCWDAKVIKDYTVAKNPEIFCVCGNLIGKRVPKGVRMKQNAFTCSGNITNK
jgi:hypothetical protein